MTSKERAALRARANTLEAILQVGKGGINDNLISQIDDALNVRDLIKIRVLLETAPEQPKELAGRLAEATHSDVVQVIGGVIVLYRELKEAPKPKAKAKKAAKPVKKGKVVRGLRQRTADKEASRQQGPSRRGAAGRNRSEVKITQKRKKLR